MKKQEIYNTIKMLAKSQGFYGRILAMLDEKTESEKGEILDYLEKQNFKDSVDMVLYFEC